MSIEDGPSGSCTGSKPAGFLNGSICSRRGVSRVGEREGHCDTCNSRDDVENDARLEGDVEDCDRGSRIAIFRKPSESVLLKGGQAGLLFMLQPDSSTPDTRVRMAFCIIDQHLVVVMLGDTLETFPQRQSKHRALYTIHDMTQAMSTTSRVAHATLSRVILGTDSLKRCGTWTDERTNGGTKSVPMSILVDALSGS